MAVLHLDLDPWLQVYKAAARLPEAGSREALYDAILTYIRDELGYERARLYQVEPTHSGRVLRGRASVGLSGTHQDEFCKSFSLKINDDFESIQTEALELPILFVYNSDVKVPEPVDPRRADRNEALSFYVPWVGENPVIKGGGWVLGRRPLSFPGLDHTGEPVRKFWGS